MKYAYKNQQAKQDISQHDKTDSMLENAAQLYTRYCIISAVLLHYGRTTSQFSAAYIFGQAPFGEL